MEKTKEEILYNAINSRGGFKGISFEQFTDWIKNGSIDMRKGLESSFAAMEEYRQQGNCFTPDEIRKIQELAYEEGAKSVMAG